MRQHLQQHLQHQEALVGGFVGFVARHADVLAALVTAPAAPSPGKAPQPRGMVSAAELDRLAFLLRWAWWWWWWWVDGGVGGGDGWLLLVVAVGGG